MAASSYYEKLTAAHDYGLSGKLDGRVLLIKAANTGLTGVDESYGLAEICGSEDKLTVFSVSGDHRNFIQAESCDRVVEIVEQWL